MQTRLYGLLAETSLHPGTGQDAGHIDQPVAREVTTDYPVIVGSAFKGALRDKLFWQHYEAEVAGLSDDEREARHPGAVKAADDKCKPFFGESDSAGAILVSDVRLLMLPIRSLTSAYYWVTCPQLIERCQRDLIRLGISQPDDTILEKDFSMEEYSFLGPPNNAEIHLEERQFTRQADLPDELVELMQRFIGHAATRNRVGKQLVVLSDVDFAWFARYGLPVNARNNLDRITKASKNLWYEETLPSDTLFYSLLAERNAGTLATLHDQLMQPPYIQVGGNETVGQGWLLLKAVEESGEAGKKEASHA